MEKKHLVGRDAGRAESEGRRRGSKDGQRSVPTVYEIPSSGYWRRRAVRSIVRKAHSRNHSL